MSEQLARSVKMLEAADFSEEMIREAKKHPSSARLHYSVQDATNLTYADASFDAVVISNALHIMPEPEKALAEIRRLYRRDPNSLMTAEYINPSVVFSPQDAFYSDKQSLPLRDCENRVCAEFVMCYPPGIPILAPGELITKDILDYILYAKEKGCSMTGPEDMELTRLNVMAGT